MPRDGEGGADAVDAVDAVDRFRRSMQVTYEMWHDGIGYDLDAIGAATPPERTAIEQVLLSRGVQDWRDVEALLALGSPAARAAVADAGVSGPSEIRVAVARQAPELVAEEERAASIVHALEHATFGYGLSAAIDVAAEFHPPAVVDALLRGALVRDGDAAVHFAALLLFIHGVTDEAFDMDERPFVLRFHATGEERWGVFQELCARIGVNPAPFRGHRA